MRTTPHNPNTVQQAWEAYADAVAKCIEAELAHGMSVRIVSEAKEELE